MEETLHEFWFSKEQPDEFWFQHGRSMDNYISEHFREMLVEAEQGRLKSWHRTKHGFIAVVLLLDQFSRHIYRGTSKAYTNDARALQWVETYLPNYLDTLTPKELVFVLLPYQHTTQLKYQLKGQKILENLLENNPGNKVLQLSLRHQIGHLTVLKKFKRFPKRHKTHTPLEQAYIQKTPHLPY